MKISHHVAAALSRGAVRRLCMRTLARRVAPALLFGLTACCLSGAQTAPTVPATPAGQALSAYLAAFNSAERTQIAAFVAKYNPPGSADGLLGFSNQTGGFTLLSVERSEPDAIAFRVKGRGDHLTAYGTLHLATLSPPKIDTLQVRVIPAGARIDDITLNAASRQRAMDAIAKDLSDFYIFPDVAAKMIAAMQAHARAGDYNNLDSGFPFAARLQQDLRAVSHDRHLFVDYQPFLTPEASAGPAPPSPEDEARFRTEVLRDNCAFNKLEILPHNIGYIRLNAFQPPSICADTVTAAMDFVAHSDALIFDLRGNHGGAPDTVDLIVSYLFAQPTHINDMLSRPNNETRQYWTLPSVPGTRFLDRPVFVLTSHNTFSGGEEFTYDLQTQKRATIVGETTGGGAHPVEGMPAGEHFIIGVPSGRPINPVTHKDWEGTGVTPDVPTPAADALTVAQKLAIEQLDRPSHPANPASGATQP